MEEDDDTTKVLPEWVELEYRVRIRFLLARMKLINNVFFFTSKCLFWLETMLLFTSLISLAPLALPWPLLSVTRTLKINTRTRKHILAEYWIS